MRNRILFSVAVWIALSFQLATSAHAASTLAGLGIDGSVYEVNPVSGALTLKSGEATTSTSLGGIARKKNNLYYIAAPSGTSENAIYTANLVTGVLSHVDLAQAAGEDEVRVLFFYKKKLHGVFYNGTAGTAGVYRINTVTGATTLVLDLSALNVEPIGGSFARLDDDFLYILVKPEADSSVRQLLKFKPRANSATLKTIQTSTGTSVRCDRIKPDASRKNFVCLASFSTTQVDVCKLTRTGKATVKGTLEGVERLASGHTMVTDGKNYYAFVYVPGDTNAQRLVRFNTKGVIKSMANISSLFVGAKFGKEDDEPVLVS